MSHDFEFLHLQRANKNIDAVWICSYWLLSVVVVEMVLLRWIEYMKIRIPERHRKRWDVEKAKYFAYASLNLTRSIFALFSIFMYRCCCCCRRNRCSCYCCCCVCINKLCESLIWKILSPITFNREWKSKRKMMRIRWIADDCEWYPFGIHFENIPKTKWNSVSVQILYDLQNDA